MCALPWRADEQGPESNPWPLVKRGSKEFARRTRSGEKPLRSQDLQFFSRLPGTGSPKALRLVIVVISPAVGTGCKRGDNCPKINIGRRVNTHPSLSLPNMNRPFRCFNCLNRSCIVGKVWESCSCRQGDRESRYYLVIINLATLYDMVSHPPWTKKKKKKKKLRKRGSSAGKQVVYRVINFRKTNSQ